MTSTPMNTTSSAVTLTTPMNTTSSAVALTTSAQNKSTGNREDDEYHTLLAVIYTTVLLIGTTSLSITIHFMKSRTFSTTSVAVVNLIFAHFLFLLTVPFRIYYHVAQEWSLNLSWCKVVSSMVHIHMYISFGIYIVILVTRLMVFYRDSEQLPSSRRIYARVASVMLWMIVLMIVTYIIYFHYGKSSNDTSLQCFRFGREIESPAPRVINYIISTLFIIVAVSLTGLQAYVLCLLYRKHHQCCTSQQDFGAQQKSLTFALVMVVCFIPYHIFRLYYLEHRELENLNEVFLSLTTFNCLDMLVLFRRRACLVCLPGKSI
ncbi:probable G-protein coupled receptor 141 [Corythoichthys intestinalis]|uniref:probable G-protein coupled receptor 141 n=1 Tax=Corythoichthys intestinalis TaxID=161448 RepID=UPI0025A5D67A|nr:probable G-protein coupled receptor 141 [Corythoichthys intestinalis]XP_061810177.1 probable G-protein coupled receptor 141 [Nerophis lumbriciformis]